MRLQCCGGLPHLDEGDTFKGALRYQRGGVGERVAWGACGDAGEVYGCEPKEFYLPLLLVCFDLILDE